MAPPSPRIQGKRFSTSQPRASRCGLRSPLSSVGDLPRLLTVGDASRNCCWCRLAERSNPVLESRLCISLTPMQSSYPPLYRWTIGPSTTRDPPPRDTACAPRSRRRSPGGLGRHIVVGHGDDDHFGQPPLPEDGPAQRRSCRSGRPAPPGACLPRRRRGRRRASRSRLWRYGRYWASTHMNDRTGLVRRRRSIKPP